MGLKGNKGYPGSRGVPGIKVDSVRNMIVI